MKWLLVALLLAIPSAAAYDEAEAPVLSDDVVRVWHDPAVPEPGQQWTGGIELAPGHNITEVRYQICRVPYNCFAPPTPAEQTSANTWQYETAQYTDPPVAWGINGRDQPPGEWRVGVGYVFVYADGSMENFPHGVEFSDPRCKEGGELGTVGCSETHYFVFSMPGSDPDKGAPALPAFIVLSLVAALAVRRK